MFYQPSIASNLLYADQTADLKLEGNFEYRFDIFGNLKGAIFTDYGNIWDIKKILTNLVHRLILPVL